MYFNSTIGTRPRENTFVIKANSSDFFFVSTSVNRTIIWTLPILSDDGLHGEKEVVYPG